MRARYLLRCECGNYSFGGSSGAVGVWSWCGPDSVRLRYLCGAAVVLVQVQCGFGAGSVLYLYGAVR